MAKMGFETNRVIYYDWHNKPEEKYGYRFKSQIERKWADYLEAIKNLGAISSWEYEPDRFDCGLIYRKQRFYTPDFKVIEKNGDFDFVVYHETKTSLRQKDVSRFRWLYNSEHNVSIVLILPYCAKDSKQALLRQQAQKYILRIVYANPLFNKFGIK